MKHFGDITQIHGWDVPLVDIVTGGSPCQDLSVAGKRAGLEGERSGLFMEQIRIIKEMRDYDRRTNGRTDELIRPRFMVWENVCGAFSSNGGEDFRAVLEETARISDANASIPRLPSGQSWSDAGIILGDGWSIAWRVHDAQFWGVAQRRRRISLVADFGGGAAPKVLFESRGLPRDFSQSESKRQRLAMAAGASIKEASIGVKCYRKSAHPRDESFPQNYEKTEVADTLNVFDNSEKRTPILILENHPNDSSEFVEENIDETISFQERAGCAGGGKGILIQHERTGALSTLNNQYVLDNKLRNVVAIENHPNDSRAKITGEVVQTLSSRMGTGGNNVPLVMEDNTAIAIGHDLRSAKFTLDDKSDLLTSTDYKEPMKVFYHSIVRRLTPLECERLQGYPDGWTDIGDWIDSKGKKHKGNADSPRYKALGNSIALPFWQWMAERMVNQYDFDYQPTMASLFDGIGGFPLVFSRCGCKPIWASEIEEFPIAVTKLHFPEQ